MRTPVSHTHATSNRGCSAMATLPPAAWHADAPVSLLASADTERYLTPDQCAALFKRITQLTKEGDTLASINSTWSGTTSWVRNKIRMSTDRTDHTVAITRIVRGARGTAATNQFDDQSLIATIQLAEHQILRQRENPDVDYVSGRRTNESPKLFADATYNLLASGRSTVGRDLVRPTIDQKMLAAGYIEAAVTAMGVYDTKGLASHSLLTNAQYTVTVRSPDGTASGWAGMDHTDWARIDTTTLSARALDKCIKGLNPVSIEPGRYTSILEPQAVYALTRTAFVKNLFWRNDNERYGNLPYNLRPVSRSGGGHGIAKFGMQLMDERITIDTDPMDPDAGYLPFTSDGTPYGKVTWIENGVLRQLPYDADFALEMLGSPVAHPYTPAFRMSGGTTTIDEMIATCQRGVFVTRFLGVGYLDSRSVLSTGTTADGTWLIERGKISRPIRDFRFNVSPLHALNQVELLGVPQRIYGPGAPALVPPLRIKEFHFNSTSDVI